jgi:hypothetical protein
MAKLDCVQLIRNHRASLKLLIPFVAVFLAVLFVVLPARASLVNVYVAATAQGAASGADCNDALPYTWFNAGGSWGTGASQIGPGTTVHLCGTFTATAGASGYLTFQGGGSNANPITLIFETGALITSPYWTGPVININANSYITVDGGTNGTIQATANGSALANQADNGMCVNNGWPGGNSTNITVQNLTCANIYVDSSLSDNGGQDTYGIAIWNTSNLVIQNNTIHDVKWAIVQSYAVGNAYSNLTVTGNTIYDIDHAWFATDSDASGTAQMTNWNIYGNTVHDFANWDNTLDNNHHDGFHLNTNSASSQFTNFHLYNNYLYGDVGAYGNAGFFSYPASASSINGVYIFNNVFVNNSANHCWANGPMGLAGPGSVYIVNNTFVSDASSCQDSGLIFEDGSTGLTFENNIVQNAANAAIYMPQTTSVTALNYNNYYQSSTWEYAGNLYGSLASWQSATGLDMKSNLTNPNLGTNYQPNSGSSVLGTGVNLAALCSSVAQLCTDKGGFIRPAVGSTQAWSVGAYQSVSNAPNPPTGVSATAE